MYYGELDRLAKAHPAGCNKIPVYSLSSTGSNGEYIHVRGTYGLFTPDSDQGALWRCVLEGIGYDYMEITDRYRKAGIDLSQLTITESSWDAL